MSTETSTRSINDMRINVLSRVAEACMVQGLAAPMDVSVTHFVYPSVSLRLDDDQPAEVDAWVEFLSLPPAVDTVYERGGKPWVGHRAQGFDEDGGLWLGFHQVEVWTAVHDEDEVLRLTALAALGS